MHGIKIFNDTLTYHPLGYSPVMLWSSVPKIVRLMLVVFLAIFGTLLNGFFVSSFFITRRLRKRGNIFLGCLGLVDMIVTSGIMPISAVVIMSGEWDNIYVCRIVQCLAQSSMNAYNLFFTFVAGEHYYRICTTPAEYNAFLDLPLEFLSFVIFFTSFGLSGFGIYYELDYDYCRRLHNGDTYYRVGMSLIMEVIPALVTLYCMWLVAVHVRRNGRTITHYRRSYAYRRDCAGIYLNCWTFLMYVLGWLPYVIVAADYPNATNFKYYNAIWFGLLRSVFTSVMYGVVNRNFRRAYSHLFNYCFYRTTLTTPYNNRPRRAVVQNTATGDVKVHILHLAYNPHGQQRGPVIQETQNL